MNNKCIDLSHCSYFEVGAGAGVEVFIDGQSRMISYPLDSSRVYVLIFPEYVFDVDDDNLPF